MAIYHLSVQVISRGQGRSCVAAAAYRAGEKLEDERQGLTHDYSRRHDVRDTFILAPDSAPAWVQDRQALWSAVDAAEKRKDARTAREVNLALPRELTPEQQREAVQEFVQAAFVSRGMVADVAIHEGHNDQEPNPHAHILLTTRTITPEGFGGKDRDWNAKELLVNWRTQWEVTCNAALEDAQQSARIDARSLAAQKIHRLPTVHEGPAVRQMERRGIAADRGNLNRVVRQQQAVVVNLAAVQKDRQALADPTTDRSSGGVANPSRVAGTGVSAASEMGSASGPSADTAGCRRMGAGGADRRDGRAKDGQGGVGTAAGRPTGLRKSSGRGVAPDDRIRAPK